jgi:fermentation-respiration switch protein FrsA (DUF1100 family)
MGMRIVRFAIPLLASFVLFVPSSLRAEQPATRPIATAATPTTPPAWLSTYFRYDRPDDLAIEMTTPTADQVRFRGRPKQFGEADLKLAKTDKPAEPVKVGPINVRRLRFRDADGDIVPALLCTPADTTGPFPLAIAVHGLGSNKAQVCGQVAPALVKRGFAVLAPDMPAHGERRGDPRELYDKRDWITAITLHRRAVIDILQCIDLAEQLGADKLAEVDASRGVVLAGYSMGSWLDSIAGPLDPRVRAMVLMVGGATDAARIAPMLRLFPQIAAADPLLSLPRFAGRPLLMLNAKNDRIVTPQMAERLFEAAAEPKEQKWYEGGHLLPKDAFEYAAQWVAETWESVGEAVTR